jgi:hypothetical protein
VRCKITNATNKNDTRMSLNFDRIYPFTNSLAASKPCRACSPHGVRCNDFSISSSTRSFSPSPRSTILPVAINLSRIARSSPFSSNNNLALNNLSMAVFPFDCDDDSVGEESRGPRRINREARAIRLRGAHGAAKIDLSSTETAPTRSSCFDRAFQYCNSIASGKTETERITYRHQFTRS